MSVVFVSPLFETFSPSQSGSIAVVQYDLCRAAKGKGAEPYVIARQMGADLYDWPHTILVDYPEIEFKSAGWWLARAQRKAFGGEHLGDYTYCQRIARAIAAQKLDRYPLIVHYQPEAALFLRKKFPHAFIAFWSHGFKDSPKVRHQLKSAVDLAIGVSDFQSHWLMEYFGFEKERVATVYNGIDASFFSPAPADTKSTPDTITITFAGRVLEEKGLDVLLRAALKLPATTPAFQIQVLGSDRRATHVAARKYRRELDALIGELEHRGIKVHEFGHISREQMPEMLQRAQISVVPTRCDEAFGLSTLEGMACGLATVVSNTGGTPEVVGDAALLFERDDVEGLAKHLENLIEDESLRKEYSRRGIERAQRFPRDQMWARLVEVLPATADPTAPS